MHPETIDAMDYLYAQDEHGPRPVHVLLLPHDRIRRARPERDGGRHDRRQAADLRHRRPAHHRHVRHLVPLPSRRHHATAEWRPLRGWDRTHEYDAAYELVETIFGGHSARRGGVDDHLENGVYSFQYHPELARDPSVERRQGHAGLCALRHQPGRAQELLDREPARALPAHGRLRGRWSSRCATAAARSRWPTRPTGASPRWWSSSGCPFGSVWDGERGAGPRRAGRLRHGAAACAGRPRSRCASRRRAARPR